MVLGEQQEHLFDDEHATSLTRYRAGRRVPLAATSSVATPAASPGRPPAPPAASPTGSLTHQQPHPRERRRTGEPVHRRRESGVQGTGPAGRTRLSAPGPPA
ncbi:hypothetical protein ACFFX0_26065 [Citricoccus parietis]|uniref:Uncharacterized protein n=1 Tax=Citricoccus parietis TaxID=592307 RepID=A0ABV5G691_9MICC